MIELHGCDELNVKWKNWIIHKIQSPCITISHATTGPSGYGVYPGRCGGGTKTFHLSLNYAFFQVFSSIPTIVGVSKDDLALTIYKHTDWCYHPMNYFHSCTYF